MIVRQRIEAFAAQCSKIHRNSIQVDLPKVGQVTKVLESGLFSQKKVQVGFVSVGQVARLSRVVQKWSELEIRDG